MSPLMALWMAVLTSLTSVKGVSVAPVGDRTEVVIAVDGQVSVKDFTLDNPARLVLDIEGARYALPRERFIGIERGGIRSLRASQFRATTVRVVFDLQQPVKYTVHREEGLIRVSFPNPAGAFEPWHAGTVVVAGQPNGDARVAQSAERVAAPTTAAPAAAPATQPATAALATQSAATAPTTQLVATGPATGSAATAPATRTMATAPATQSVAAREPYAAAGGAHVRSAAQQSQEPRITVHFQNSPIVDVLVTFAEFSGRSIVPGSSVTGTVTADIRDQPWDVALREILHAHGLGAVETEGGIIRVDKLEQVREREKVEELVTRQFPIRYVAVDSLVKTVQAFLSERGKVTTNPAANALVVTDARSVLDRIEPAIAQLDVRRPQVTISAKIIFIDRTSLQELGFIYDLKDVEGPDGSGGNSLNEVIETTTGNPFDVTFMGSSIAALANANDRVAAPAVQVLTAVALGRFSLFSFIEALQQLQLSDVQAAPVVTTMDNREARIQVGEETPIRVIDAGSATGGGVPPRASVQMKETGVILRVKPHVTGDHVLLDLHAERSSIALAPSDVGITFRTQESQTQVLVKDGETVVIGGLTISEKTESRSGIPFLMDLPGIGKFFRTTKEQEIKRDLLIMVTPHIVKDTQG